MNLFVTVEMSQFSDFICFRIINSGLKTDPPHKNLRNLKNCKILIKQLQIYPELKTYKNIMIFIINLSTNDLKFIWLMKNCVFISIFIIFRFRNSLVTSNWQRLISQIPFQADWNTSNDVATTISSQDYHIFITLEFDLSKLKIELLEQKQSEARIPGMWIYSGRVKNRFHFLTFRFFSARSVFLW